jgi:midasin (ATPase involved in ribosome maturation)
MELFHGSSINTNESNSNQVSKLLIILSDGRGIFYEGMEKVKHTVQKALQEKIFIVFIILDMPGKNSIFDIKMLTENKAVIKKINIYLILKFHIFIF